MRGPPRLSRKPTRGRRARLTKEEAALAGQLPGLVGICGRVFLASLVVWAALNAIMGIRVSEEDREVPLDVSEAGIEAYPDFTPA